VRGERAQASFARSILGSRTRRNLGFRSAVGWVGTSGLFVSAPATVLLVRIRRSEREHDDDGHNREGSSQPPNESANTVRPVCGACLLCSDATAEGAAVLD
jgi:hypothetical protein